MRARTTERKVRSRSVLPPILVVLSVVAFAAWAPSIWLRRTLLDTDRYVATVAPLADDPAIQRFIAGTVSSEVFEALSYEERLRETLAERAPRLTFLAAPLTAGIRGFVEERVGDIVSSQAFATHWSEANRAVHQQLVAALEGRRHPRLEADGKVVLQLLPLIMNAMRAVAAVAGQLTGTEMLLPDAQSSVPPAAQIARLESALGTDLPENFGTIPIYHGGDFATVQRTVATLARSVTFVTIVAILLGAAAIALSRRRRRTLVQLLASVVVVLALERGLATVAAGRIVGRATGEGRDAVRAVVDHVLESLLLFTGWLLVLALLLLVATLVSGPYPWAAGLRRLAEGSRRGILRAPGSGS